MSKPPAVYDLAASERLIALARQDPDPADDVHTSLGRYMAIARMLADQLDAAGRLMQRGAQTRRRRRGRSHVRADFRRGPALAVALSSERAHEAQEEQRMRSMMVLIAVMCGACEVAGSGTAVQAVAGPTVTVTVRDIGQLAVSWTADPAATSYQVFRSASGGAFAFAAVLNGSPPSSSFIDEALTGGVLYCYAVRAAFDDGSTSDMGAAGCGTAAGSTAMPQATIEYSAALASPLTGAAMRFTTNPSAWDIGDTSAILTCPITLPVGTTITALGEHVRKASGSSSTLDVELMDADTTTGAVATTFLAQNSTASPGFVTVGASGLSIAVRAGHVYELRISEATTAPGAGADFVYGWQVTTAP